MKARIPWLRVFVEGVVIVGSILLAFGIQAWWDGRQDELQLRRGLAGVLEELSAVATVMEFDGALRQRALSNTEALQSLVQEEGVSQTLAVPDTLLVGLFSDYVSDHPTAMAEAFISSGYLDAVQNDVLRRSLLSWIALLQDHRDDETRASEFGSLELGPYLREEFDVVRAQAVQRAWARGQLASSPGGGQLATSIRADTRLRNLVGRRLVLLGRIARQNEALRSLLEELNLLVRAESQLH